MHNILYSTVGGIRTQTHHVNVAHATREPGQQNIMDTYMRAKRAGIGRN